MYSEMYPRETVTANKPDSQSFFKFSNDFNLPFSQC